jgi:penicillin-binding protein 1A
VAEAPARWEIDQLPRAQSALVSIEADTGALRALAGGFSFAGNKFNRATQARRQPGSSFKPFLYAAAFERGFNPASIVLDAPVVFRDRRGHLWRPQNDSGNFAGPMRLREALVQSRNLVSVRLLDANRRRLRAQVHQPLRLQRSGPAAEPVDVARHRLACAAVHRARLRGDRQRRLPRHAVVRRRGQGPQRQGDLEGKAGDRLPHLPPGPGTADRVERRRRFRPRQHAGTGVHREECAEGRAAVALPADAVLAQRAIDERVSYQLVSMMRDVVQRGTGTAAKVLGREDVGGKTGSTNDHRDAWFSGFGGGVVTTVLGRPR